MYNYCQLIGDINSIDETNKTFTLKMKREFKNANGVIENYNLTIYAGDFLFDLVKENLANKRVSVKGRLEPTETNGCKIFAERIMSLSDINPT